MIEGADFCKVKGKIDARYYSPDNIGATANRHTIVISETDIAETETKPIITIDLNRMLSKAGFKIIRK
jgi:hypothetical protein